MKESERNKERCKQSLISEFATMWLRLRVRSNGVRPIRLISKIRITIAPRALRQHDNTPTYKRLKIISLEKSPYSFDSKISPPGLENSAFPKSIPSPFYTQNIPKLVKNQLIWKFQLNPPYIVNILEKSPLSKQIP